MAIRNTSIGKLDTQKKKRPGVHSKNASKGQTGHKSKYKGQGR